MIQACEFSLVYSRIGLRMVSPYEKSFMSKWALTQQLALERLRRFVKYIAINMNNGVVRKLTADLCV